MRNAFNFQHRQILHITFCVGHNKYCMKGRIQKLSKLKNEGDIRLQKIRKCVTPSIFNRGKFYT